MIKTSKATMMKLVGVVVMNMYMLCHDGVECTNTAFITPILRTNAITGMSTHRITQPKVQLQLQIQLKAKSKNNNEEEEQEKKFKPNKPISLPSLENPPDAGPLYSTCRSVTGIEQQQQQQQEEGEIKGIGGATEEEAPFIPNKPIELDSLKAQDVDRSFLGIQPRSNYDDKGNLIGKSSESDDEEPLLMETGLGVITSSAILGGSIYFILAVFMDNGDGVDPLMIPLSF